APAPPASSGEHQLSHGVLGALGAGALPKVRRTTMKAATTAAAARPETYALASTGPTGREMRPVRTAGRPRPTYAATKNVETTAARCEGSASRFSSLWPPRKMNPTAAPAAIVLARKSHRAL